MCGKESGASMSLQAHHPPSTPTCSSTWTLPEPCPSGFLQTLCYRALWAERGPHTKPDKLRGGPPGGDGGSFTNPRTKVTTQGGLDVTKSRSWWLANVLGLSLP